MVPRNVSSHTVKLIVRKPKPIIRMKQLCKQSKRPNKLRRIDRRIHQISRKQLATSANAKHQIRQNYLAQKEKHATREGKQANKKANRKSGNQQQKKLMLQ